MRVIFIVSRSTPHVSGSTLYENAPPKKLKKSLKEPPIASKTLEKLPKSPKKFSRRFQMAFEKLLKSSQKSLGVSWKLWRNFQITPKMSSNRSKKTQISQKTQKSLKKLLNNSPETFKNLSKNSRKSIKNLPKGSQKAPKMLSETFKKL